MKKFVFASVMALAAISLVTAPLLRAQDSITIKDPAEFNSYQMASTQSDPKAKAAALESFLQAYPQSVVKKAVLDSLTDTYQQLGDVDHALSAATRLLQVDPTNMKALTLSVMIKKGQCGKTQDAQTCDDAAALARKGLATPKPADTSDPDWRKQTGAIYPLLHSAMAVDDIVGKKDFKAGIEEYRQELMLFPVEATKVPGPGLNDTLQLAEAYARLTPPDMVNAVWFYARALAYAPDNFKPQIEKKLDYWYKKYHGAMDGLDDIKAQTAANLFPPGGAPVIKAAKTPPEFAHDVVTGGGLDKLNLSDKEFILANGSLPSAADATKTDADTMWAAMKDQATPVPGIVIEASATVIKVAVSDDAKSAKAPDFIGNLKKPLDDKDIPAVGFEFKMPPATAPSAALIGTMDSYRQVPATATTAQTAEIVVKDGEIQVEKKKAVPAHKPAAGHHTAH
jgi:hypothetical protein